MRVLVFLTSTIASLTAIRIGCILLSSDHEYAKYLIDLMVVAINNGHVEMKNSCNIDQTVYAIVNSTDYGMIREKVCELASSGVHVIIGPPEKALGTIVELICRELRLVYIKYYPEFTSGSIELPNTSLNLNAMNDKGQLLKQLISYWKWQFFTFVYTSSDAPKQLTPFLSDLSSSPALLEVDETDDSNFMRAALALRDICDKRYCWRKINKVILDMSPRSTLMLLDAALKLGMINIHNWFLITSLDDLGSHLDQYTHNNMRISLISIYGEDIPNGKLRNMELIRNLYEKWSFKYEQDRITPYKDFAYLYDALILTCSIEKPYPKVGSCTAPRELSLYKAIQLAEPVIPLRVQSFVGMTGRISFDSYGNRAESQINIWELGVHGYPILTGDWKTEAGGSHEFSMRAKQIKNTHENVQNSLKSQRVLRVTSIEEKPYVMRKILPDGKVTYEGFCVDLLDKLAEHLDFDYKLTIVKDATYGKPIPNKTNEWDGMIGEILRGEVDMAVAPITVTAGRLEVIDFTDPFLQLGISMLMRQPNQKASSTLTSFLWPLSASVWTFSALATFVTALIVTCIAVASPIESPIEFNLQNSLWYLVCILLRAGSGYNCQSGAARFASAVWWIFTLVIFAQYTANFAAVLTVDRKSIPFNSFEELGNQTEYSFGTFLNGSTMQFFAHSRIETFRRIWEQMNKITPSAFVKSNAEGVQRALDEKYVFLMESATLDYQVTQNCNLTRVGNVVLGSNGYSIALPKGSKWREKLTRQILDLNEKGIIMMIKENWWKKPQQECNAGEPENENHALGADHVKGLFLLLALGLGIGLLVSLLEKCVFTVTRFTINQKKVSTVFFR